MKIGILTFYFAHNYGALLQAYALQEYLKSLGHDVTMINYRQKNLARNFSVFDIKRFVSKNFIILIKRIIVETLLFSRRCLRYFRFEKFIKANLNLSKEVNGKNIPDDFDVYIMGSDQIWNPKITKGFDTIYFGDFSVIKSKKISYAASMETNFLTKEQETFLVSQLKNINKISVRESILANLLQPLTEKYIYTVLDPTLLLDTAYWDKLIEMPPINKKYILIYQVKPSYLTLDIANSMAKQLGAIVLEVSSIIMYYKIKKNYKQCVSPALFIGLVKNAACIITTSFHGTVFSMIFKKPFYTIKVGDRDTRVISLLNSLELSDRFLSENDSLLFSEIDYTNVDSKLEILRQESVSFIQNALLTEN
jgi:hypothetical protein